MGVDKPGRPRSASAGPDAPVKVLYIGGYGRSGSTLLERMLGRVPGFWPVGELVHLWRRGLIGDERCGCGASFSSCPVWGRVGERAFGGWDSVDGEAMADLQREVDRNRFIPAMISPGLRPAYRESLGRYQAILEGVYGAIRDGATTGGGGVVVDSSKHASSAFLLRRVPGIDLRVVHLVRDSRGVAYSWTKQVRKPEAAGEAFMPTHSPARSSARWLSYNLLFDVLRGTGVPTLLLRYESLVADPAAALARVVAHAGEAVPEGGFSFLGDGAVQVAPDHTVSGNPMRFQQGAIRLRLDEAWRTGLPKRQRTVVGAMTWPLQMRYGYARRNTRGNDSRDRRQP